MEKLGLGTKSTRHSIIERLYQVKYVQGNPIEPSALGMAVCDALEAELKLARGEVKTVLNNQAQGKLRNEQLRAELERKLALDADEELREKAERYRKLYESESAENMRLRGVLEEIAHIARSRKVE